MYYLNLLIYWFYRILESYFDQIKKTHQFSTTAVAFNRINNKICIFQKPFSPFPLHSCGLEKSENFIVGLHLHYLHFISHIVIHSFFIMFMKYFLFILLIREWSSAMFIILVLSPPFF